LSARVRVQLGGARSVSVEEPVYAADNAEAAGARLGPVVHIDDVDPENAGAERYRRHAAGSESSAEDLPLGTSWCPPLSFSDSQ
jgi:hypothetical protein